MSVFLDSRIQRPKNSVSHFALCGISGKLQQSNCNYGQQFMLLSGGGAVVVVLQVD